jgi:CubicO group peptidase (beta-lactamase class C family)
MNRALRTASLLLVLSAVFVSAQQPSVAPPGARPQPIARNAGVSLDRLARIDTVLQRYVDENRIAGAVGLVLRDGRPIYERAVGWSDKEAGRKMTTDTIFRIASQSKALTSVAILQLVEEGRITLGNPVGDFIPGVQEDDGCGQERHRDLRCPGNATVYDSGSADPHGGNFVRHRRAGRITVRSKGSRAGSRLRLVHGRQG